MNFLLTISIALALSIGAADSAFAQMSEYETKMLAIAKANHETNVTTAAYSRCAVVKQYTPFTFLDGCLARFGVIVPETKDTPTTTAKVCVLIHGSC